MKLVIYLDDHECNIKCSKAPQKGYFNFMCFILLQVIKNTVVSIRWRMVAAGGFKKKNLDLFMPKQ